MVAKQQIPALTQQDFEALARMAWAENRTIRQTYGDRDKAFRGTTDVVLNRVASPVYPNSVSGVLNEKADKVRGSQFTPAAQAGGSWAYLPSAPAEVDRGLAAYVTNRAAGGPSTVGGALNYMNPNAADRKSMRAWGDAFMANPDTVRVGKRGGAEHAFGTGMGANPIEAQYKLSPALAAQFGYGNPETAAASAILPDYITGKESFSANIPMPRMRPAGGPPGPGSYTPYTKPGERYQGMPAVGAPPQYTAMPPGNPVQPATPPANLPQVDIPLPRPRPSGPPPTGMPRYDPLSSAQMVTNANVDDMTGPDSNAMDVLDDAPDMAVSHGFPQAAAPPRMNPMASQGPMPKSFMPDPRPRPDFAPKAPAATIGGTVTVKKGDSLWNIAERELGDGKRFREIADVNSIANPNRLKIGQVLTVPGREPVTVPDPNMRPIGGNMPSILPNNDQPPMPMAGQEELGPGPVPRWTPAPTSRGGPPPGVPGMEQDTQFGDRRMMQGAGSMQQGGGLAPGMMPQPAPLQSQFQPRPMPGGPGEMPAGPTAMPYTTMPWTRGMGTPPSPPPAMPWTQGRGVPPIMQSPMPYTGRGTGVASVMQAPAATTPDPRAVRSDLTPSQMDRMRQMQGIGPYSVRPETPGTLPSNIGTAYADTASRAFDIPGPMTRMQDAAAPMYQPPPPATPPIGNLNYSGGPNLRPTLPGSYGVMGTQGPPQLSDLPGTEPIDDSDMAAFEGTGPEELGAYPLDPVTGVPMDPYHIGEDETNATNTITEEAPTDDPIKYEEPSLGGLRNPTPARQISPYGPLGGPRPMGTRTPPSNMGIKGLLGRAVTGPRGGILGLLDKTGQANFTPFGPGRIQTPMGSYAGQGSAPYGNNGGTTNWQHGTTNALGGANALSWQGSGGNTVTVAQDPWTGTYYGPTYS
jgi:LysM repeat protein